MSTMTPSAFAAHRAALGREPVEPPQCAACWDLGWVRDDLHPGDPLFGLLIRCPVCGAERWREWLAANCGLERGELLKRLHDWKEGEWAESLLREQRRKALAAMEAALEKRTGWLTFYGDNGAGKTHGGQIVLNELRFKGSPTLYTTFPKVLRYIRQSIAGRADYGVWWQRLEDMPALFVDEVTRGSDTAFARERLWELVDVRWRRRDSHLTLWATNADPREVLPPDNPLAYLWSRMRSGVLVELRGDCRGAM